MGSLLRSVWLFAFLFLFGCSLFQPVPQSPGTPGVPTETLQEQYPGPRYIVRETDVSPVDRILEEILREHGFRAEDRSLRSRTYLLPRAHHPMVDKVRVSFYFRPGAKSLHVYTRTEASISTLLVFKSSFSDVSNRPQTVDRLDTLFRELERRLQTHAVRVAGPNSSDPAGGL